MSLKTIVTSLAAALLALGAQAGHPKQYCIDVKDFNELRVGDGINVIYTCADDSAGIVTYTTTPDVAPMIQFSNDKNKLKIQVNTDGIIPKNLPTITVRSRFLQYAQNAGDSTLTVERPAPGAKMKLSIIGNGNIVANDIEATVVEGKIEAGHGTLSVSGKTPYLKLRQVGGSSTINTVDMVADRVDVKMAGTGSVYVNAIEQLTITGISSGKVYLLGKPEIKNRTMGSVKVIEIEKPSHL